MLATPGGDWPPFTYDASDGSAVIVAAEGIDWTSTAQPWLYLPTTAMDEDKPSELTVAVDLEQASTPSLMSSTGSTTFELSLDETVS